MYIFVDTFFYPPQNYHFSDAHVFTLISTSQVFRLKLGRNFELGQQFYQIKKSL